MSTTKSPNTLAKESQLNAKKVKPIEIGDAIRITLPYTTKETITEGRGKKKEIKVVDKEHVFNTEGTIAEIKTHPTFGVIYRINLGSVRVPSEIYLDGLSSKYEGHQKSDWFKAEHVSHTFGDCGSNPFKKERFRVNFYNQEIESLLFKACYGRRSDDFNTPNYDRHSAGTLNSNEREKQFAGKTYGGVDFNPYVIDTDGNKKLYQRELVWTEEQKQLLIESIYNGIEIGKFLFRYKSWVKMEEGMLNDGHGYSWECVDGKQRFFAILHFVQNKYPDSHGNYWDDLSINAQQKFLSYGNLSYGEMGETAKDSDVIDTFLTLNFTGTPMSQEHINFVQGFKIKN